MNQAISHLDAMARQDRRWSKALCFALNLRSLILEGHPMTCEEKMSVLDGLPSGIQRTARYDVGDGARRLFRYVVERVRLRVGEARVTTLGELVVVAYGWSNVFLCVVQGGGYTKGWAILQHGISQPTYGWALAVQCLLQGFAVFFLSDRWRYNLNFSSLVIHGTTAYAVYAANPTSQALAGLVVVGVALPLCILFSFAYRYDVERGATDLGIP